MLETADIFLIAFISLRLSMLLFYSVAIFSSIDLDSSPFKKLCLIFDPSLLLPSSSSMISYFLIIFCFRSSSVVKVERSIPIHWFCVLPKLLATVAALSRIVYWGLIELGVGKPRWELLRPHVALELLKVDAFSAGLLGDACRVEG